ncbi:outer membrane lipoprotein-sorting protein [Salinimicrobium soli]|uniref:outer membrane lipoprotein-sorting protein n=2 Tax=Bacteria TaxID=2 RepID=UPI003AAFFC5D
MKIIKSLFVALLLLVVAPMTAQTAEEIIANYVENTGGEEAWKELEATKMLASVTQGGMEIPVTIYNTKDGKMAVVVNLQGQEITQMAYDGTTLWTTNFITMKPEKSNAEQTQNMALNKNDFPSALVNAEKNGYEVELVGTETKEGTETFKVKIVQEPVMQNGKEVPNIGYYYFEKENFVPIILESTQESGQLVTVGMSDYQEVGGLYFPFALNQGGQPIEIKEIVLNPEIDDSLFTFKEQ